MSKHVSAHSPAVSATRDVYRHLRTTMPSWLQESNFTKLARTRLRVNLEIEHGVASAGAAAGSCAKRPGATIASETNCARYRMPQLSMNFQFPSSAWAAVILCLFGSVGSVASVTSGEDLPVDPQKTVATRGPNDELAHMSGHMYMTPLRPQKAGDQQTADAIVTAAKTAMARYQGYRKALADGYEIFLPDVPQSQYHFTKYEYGRAAWAPFDPLKPTSLLYTKTADGGYKLVGVMYTDRVDASEEELNGRTPLSIGRWHQHINFCKAPAGQKAAYFGPDAKFGLLGSITTQRSL
jgi:hypothetical protein